MFQNIMIALLLINTVLLSWKCEALKTKMQTIEKVCMPRDYKGE